MELNILGRFTALIRMAPSKKLFTSGCVKKANPDSETIFNKTEEFFSGQDDGVDLYRANASMTKNKFLQNYVDMYGGAIVDKAFVAVDKPTKEHLAVQDIKKIKKYRVPRLNKQLCKSVEIKDIPTHTTSVIHTELSSAEIPNPIQAKTSSLVTVGIGISVISKSPGNIPIATVPLWRS